MESPHGLDACLGGPDGALDGSLVLGSGKDADDVADARSLDDDERIHTMEQGASSEDGDTDAGDGVVSGNDEEEGKFSNRLDDLANPWTLGEDMGMQVEEEPKQPVRKAIGGGNSPLISIKSISPSKFDTNATDAEEALPAETTCKVEDDQVPNLPLTLVEKQLRLIDELIASEKSYAEFLDVLVTEYIEPIQMKNVGWKRCILSCRDIAIVFCYLDQIRLLSGRLLHALECARECDEETDPRVVVKACSQVVTNFSSLFKLYAQYAATYYCSATAFVEYEAKFEDFAAFIKFNREKSKGNHLESLMIMPIQRLPRYGLFLKEIYQGGNLQRVVKRALTRVESATVFVNEAVKLEEDRRELVELQERFHNRVDLVSGYVEGRRMIKTGPLTKCSRSGAKLETLEFALFTDMIIYSEQRLSVRKRMSGRHLHVRRLLKAGEFEIVPIPEVEAAEGEESESKHADDGTPLTHLVFCLRTPTKDMRLYATSKGDRDDWVKKLKAVSRKKPLATTEVKVEQENYRKRKESIEDENERMPFSEYEVYSAEYAEQLSPSFVPDPAKPVEVQEYQRRNLIESLIEGERAYSHDLDIMVQVFVQTMLDVADGGHLKDDEVDQKALGKMRKLLCDTDIGVALHTLIQMKFLHCGLIEQFDEEWTMFCESNVNVSISKVFKTLVPLLGLYAAFMERYSILYDAISCPSMKLLQISCERDIRCRGQPMVKFLELPVERPEYYLDQIDRFLSFSILEDSERASLEESSKALCNVVEYISKRTVYKGNIDSLVSIQKRLVPTRFRVLNHVMVRNDKASEKKKPRLTFLGTVPDVVVDTRKVVLEGVFLKVSSKGKLQKIVVWLFNDVIIYGSNVGSKSVRFRRLFNVGETFAIPSPKEVPVIQGERNDQDLIFQEDLIRERGEKVPNAYFDMNENAFKLRTTTKSFVLIASDTKEMKLWVDAINQQASGQLGSDVPDRHTVYAPVRSPLSMINQCENCEKKTKALRHCCICGQAICEDCITQKVYLQGQRRGGACKKCCDVIS